MMQNVSLIISSFLNVIVLLYMCKKLSNKKQNFISIKTIFTIVIMTTYWSLSYTITNNIFRILISFLLLVASCLIIFKEKTDRSVIISFASMIILLVSELLYVALNVLIFKFDENGIQTNVFGTFLTNVIILSIALAIFKLTNKKISLLVEKLITKNKNSNLYIFFVAFATIIMLIYCIYFQSSLFWGLIFGIIIIVVYFVFTINLIKEKSNNYKLQKENEGMMQSLEEYEKMYALQRMKNHEYKNDLSVLRGLISEKNEKAINHIDKIINLKNDKKNNWMEILKRIPEGGLRGILYYKFLEMEEASINVEFTTTRFYNPTSYIKLSDDLKTKICKLLGIYLDNAMQAVVKVKEKKIYININETNNNIIFKVANSFNDDIDLDRISEKGYTTKGNGHGYGLAIAKEIIKDENKINCVTKIIKDKFIQEIEIQK